MPPRRPPPKPRKALTAQEEFTVYRRRMADQEPVETIAVDYGISSSTVYNIIRRVGLAIVEELDRSKDTDSVEDLYGLPRGYLRA